MKLTALFLLPLLLAANARAEEPVLTPEQKIERAEKLAIAARKACDLPERMQSYALKNFERFVAQVVIPELKMLNLAFLRGMNMGGSAYLPLGYCVIVFMGLPNDAYWEKSQDFYERAKGLGSLPAEVFLGFDQAGNIGLAPTFKRN
jgi:hypothetical protein